MQSGRERLREWIDRSKTNQKQAAEILGIGEVFISQILNGERLPGLANAVKIEQVTGISVESWLLTEISPLEAVMCGRRPRRRQPQIGRRAGRNRDSR